MVYNFFNKKTAVGAAEDEIMPNKELAEELHKPIIKKFGKTRVHWCFINNIWGADLPDMQLLSKLFKGIRFYYVLLAFSVNTIGYSFEREKR